MNRVEDLITSHPDFPKKGVLFKDVLPVFRDPRAYHALIDDLAHRIRAEVPNCCGLVGVESRGFMLACPLALKLDLPFIPVRKPGKLPGEVKQASFEKEYGKDHLEVQVESIQKGGTYVILDDLLATGGTLKAACDLLTECGAKVGCAFLVMEISALSGRKTVEDAGYRVESLIKY
ncbi:uncharacterized protein LOC100902589 [Galendromus occidentalis]|uniref:Adenine phosphoribosyltransferase n=1 Tax=Galendromus occidentalis TaxID=34638 RepID=A0AAJ6VXX0_9ACAR|nr:uncharacterized protein LOC100902589 [Galendromus occidentalis]